MNKRNGKRGFTMAELLIVVAIIGVLAGVSFVAVAQHQRSLERVERDSVAREIFVAAQNHLTMAEGQGFLGLADDAAWGTTDSVDGVYYFAAYRGDAFSSGAPSTLLDLMLPFGAIDETVRSGGSFIIRYQKDPATVLDVFYCSTDSRFGYDLRDADLDDLLNGYTEGKESARRNFNGKVLGWYGGEAPSTLERKTLEAPLIEVENAEKLRVLVQDPNTGTHDLQIIVTGMTSGAKKAFTLQSTAAGFLSSDSRITGGETVDGIAYDHVITLDDITFEPTDTQKGLHFADLTADNSKLFIPGEDITVQAVAFDNTAISNIAYSAEKTTNSLFEKVELTTKNSNDLMVVSVNNIRHLENLDKRVSNVTTSRTVGTGTTAKTYNLLDAVQTSDMSWPAFKTATGGDSTAIYQYKTDLSTATVSTDPGCYLPVAPDGYLFSYDGQGHSITGVKVDYAGDAGLFGAIKATAADSVTLQNLALIDFDITQKEGTDTDGNAGTLAGTLTNVTVTNVVAYDQDSESHVAANSGKAESGNAGGLIGSATNCAVVNSSASVYVASASRDAGGLIGATSGGSVTGCYSGGHTDGNGAYDDARFNVTAATGSAGGLIGSDVSTPVEYSYSTCSAIGATAGGFVATASASASIDSCYATGLVKGTVTETVSGVEIPKDGAFAYSLPGTITNCHYLEIINERPVKDASGNDTDSYEPLTALGKGGTNTNITAIDADITSYDSFVGTPDADWKPASAYDASLIKYYGGKYPLKTVEQLIGADFTENFFVAIHHGDWPAPEIFVINTKEAPADASGTD